VQPFPGPGLRFLVSTDGGAALEWARSGRELFYLSPGANIMVVEVMLRNRTLARAGPSSSLQQAITPVSTMWLPMDNVS